MSLSAIESAGDAKASDSSSAKADAHDDSHLPELDALHAKGTSAAQIGHLMTVAQHYFDKHAMPACPTELTAPVLHKGELQPRSSLALLSFRVRLQFLHTRRFRSSCTAAKVLAAEVTSQLLCECGF